MTASDEARPITVLNVDDNEVGRYAITRVLERAGYQVAEAGTAAEVFTRLEEGNIDLVILDINLPDGNGLDICNEIKADERYQHIPVLHLTATYVMTVDRLDESQADGYLMAPVEPAALLANVRALLRARRTEADLKRQLRDWLSAVDAVQGGFGVVDETGAVRQGNRALLELAETAGGAGALADIATAAVRSGGGEPGAVTLGGTRYRAQAWPITGEAAGPGRAVLLLLPE